MQFITYHSKYCGFDILQYHKIEMKLLHVYIWTMSYKKLMRLFLSKNKCWNKTDASWKKPWRQTFFSSISSGLFFSYFEVLFWFWWSTIKKDFDIDYMLSTIVSTTKLNFAYQYLTRLSNINPNILFHIDLII